MSENFKLDPVHESFHWWDDALSHQVWKEKYCTGDEADIFETQKRVVDAVMQTDPKHHEQVLECCNKGLFIPAGRIHAGAGTEKQVTLINCFVNNTLDDSMIGILAGFNNTLLTLQQGGGMGTDFSPLRPRRAILGRLGEGAQASGPIPFMHMWDRGSATIRTVGGRNGAMMGVLSDTHPDLLEFVRAKQVKGSLEQFNISVLISDAFMQAVEDDEEWTLHFHIPPADGEIHNHLGDWPSTPSPTFFDEIEQRTQYIYSIHRARDLWDLITKNTYEWSEPGVIFIDRVNDLNNLQYYENIRCCNPCGEQQMGPNDACNLAHANLSRMVRSPFTSRARFDFDLLERVTTLGIRFLDCVIDTTNYPLPEQHAKHHETRRTGLGYTGLASALAQLGLRYGHPDAVRMSERITQTMCLQAYHTSIELAKEKGPFPAFPINDPDKYLQGFAGKMLPHEMQDEIREHGIRNAVLLSIAPTGTVSVAYGDVESGCEPIFALTYDRRVRGKSGLPDDWETHKREAYTYRLYCHATGEHSTPNSLPDYFVTTQDLRVGEHVTTLAAIQKWIDSAVSKTVNCAEDLPYEDFTQVYTLAYHSGCKSCATYRPSEVRGSILSSGNEDLTNTALAKPANRRPSVLSGVTYKIRWPSWSAALYITVNADTSGKPREVFFASKDSRYQEWMISLTLMISAIFRGSEDPMFVAAELQQVTSTIDPAPVGGKFYPSLVAYIGHILEQHLVSAQTGIPAADAPSSVSKLENATPKVTTVLGVCPNCSSPSLTHQSGCTACTNCGYSKC